MTIMQVKDIINVDTISRSTTAWGSIIKAIEGVEGDVQLDFRGIQLIEPWMNEEFKQLMKDGRVYLKVYTAEELKTTIELMLALGNLKTGRVENEDILSPYVMSPKDKQVKLIKANILREMGMVDNVMTIDFSHIVSYITESVTIEALRQAVCQIHSENGCKHFKVLLSGVSATDPMLIKMAETINSLNEEGITLEIDSNDEDAIGKIITFQCVGSKKLTIQERYDIFKDTIKPRIVGMLTKYERSGRLDSLGRMGDGKPIICRPAIFDGFVKHGRMPFAKFTSFALKTFYTRQDYYLDNDGAVLKRPKTIAVEIPISDIGICDKFTGREFHFNMPVQLDKDDSLTISKINDNKIETKKVLLPEFIKMVLDDYNIEYDERALLDAIVETKRLLKEN